MSPKIFDKPCQTPRKRKGSNPHSGCRPSLRHHLEAARNHRHHQNHSWDTLLPLPSPDTRSSCLQLPQKVSRPSTHPKTASMLSVFKNLLLIFHILRHYSPLP